MQPEITMRTFGRIGGSFVVLALLFSMAAQAEIVTVTRAYEIALNNFRVAASVDGAVTFRQCDSCDPMVVRVSPSTRFLLNGAEVDLREFRKGIFQVGDRASETVIVMHHLESDVVTQISVSL